MAVLYILLFIVCLSTLVMIHELGHLLTAKMFKVYCFEYAIGFGPKLFSFKRKKGETYFSLRAIPFGGFVSMYGESETVPEGLEIDPSRSLLNIAKWKRAIIMLAGIVMNFLLAIVLFIVYEGCFTKYQARYAHITVGSGSVAETAGLKSQDFVYAQRYADNDRSLLFYDDNASLIYEDESVREVYFGINYGTLTIKDTTLLSHSVAYTKKHFDGITITADSLTISSILKDEYEADKLYIVTGFVSSYVSGINDQAYYFAVSENFSEDATNEKSIVVSLDTTQYDKAQLAAIPLGQEMTMIGTLTKHDDNGFHYLSVKDKNVKFAYPDIENGSWLGKKKGAIAPTKLSYSHYVVDESAPSGRGNKTISLHNLVLTDKDGTYYLPDNIGVSLQIDSYMNNPGEAFKAAFRDFADAGSLIYRSLGSLFTDADAWKNVGGIIAIGVTTTRTLQENGFGAFLMYWSIISVNLAIVNLLPFPGLDGWHFLVIIVEGITRKEIPAKVKNWFSIVGLVLLFALMILVVVKDIITFI